MRKEDFFEVLGSLDDDIVKGAEAPMKKKMNIKIKILGTIAACICLIIAGAVSIFNWRSSLQDVHGTMEQVYSLPSAEKMSVELVEWGGDHFKAVVVDAEDNSIFPDGAELSVVFDYDTKIILDDGTVMNFNPDEPDTEIIGWEAGTVVSVEFINYVEYRTGNRFYNQLFACCAEAKSR